MAQHFLFVILSTVDALNAAVTLEGDKTFSDHRIRATTTSIHIMTRRIYDGHVKAHVQIVV